MISRADAARDAKQYIKAASLYERHLQHVPEDAAIHIQCGHMFKEAQHFARAEYHYECARQLTPDDADLILQFGHLYKATGRLAAAERAFRASIEMAPDWAEPAIQLAELYRAGWRDHTRPPSAAVNGKPVAPADRLAAGDGSGCDPWIGISANERLVGELAPQPPESRLRSHIEEICVHWFGHVGRTPWGTRDIVRGIEAIRGYCISAIPIVEVRACLNGLRFCSEVPQGFPLKNEKYNRRLHKYVFNIWYDFSQFHEGHYDGQLHFVDQIGGIRSYTRRIVVAAPLREEQYPGSDRLVSLPPGDDRPLEQRVNARPSMVRPARRVRFPTPPRNVLVQRVDQLGDMVVSIAALRRLRELLPEARLVGLLSHANAELARTLDLLDDIVAIDFPDDVWERRRVMPLDQQYALRRRLLPFRFDVAIDLMESEVSRPLLLLSGAPYLFGFGSRGDRFPWLSAYFDGVARDPCNGMYEVPPSAQIVALIEWFGAILHNRTQIIRRDDLTIARLAPYGLAEGDRFAVLHAGARLKFSRWPHYNRLAAMILERTDLKVVLMCDEASERAPLPPELAGSNRFQLLDRRLPFDDFDAFLSFCTVFVGNDSGPAHLASLRGTNVVNVYLARHNWNEWGHENRGYIISRRVPCAGCNIHHDPEECGKGFACIINITPEEVFRTVLRCLSEDRHGD